MEDILGREINDYDIVVAKGTGRYVIGMNVGMWLGKSIVSKDLHKRSCSDVYLVENPTKAEITIRDGIIKGLKDEKSKANEIKSQKGIPTKELVVGHLYKGVNGKEVYYLGKCKITLYVQFRGTRQILTSVGGYFYLSGRVDDLLSCFDNYNVKYASENIKGLVVKNRKKLIEKLDGSIELETEFSYNKKQYNRYNSEYEVVVEYLDLK